MDKNNQAQYSKRKQLNVRVEEDLISHMKMFAIKDGVSLEKYIAKVFAIHIIKREKHG